MADHSHDHIVRPRRVATSESQDKGVHSVTNEQETFIIFVALILIVVLAVILLA
ncbi:MAG: hypothetical protein QM451_01975 [Bacillota bacterium]|nr:hypothetical protein [Bacillota bacterium]HHT89360.1 hypothetical protein [Bacillota bacterium]